LEKKEVVFLSIPYDKSKICEELWKEIEPNLRRICRVKLASCPEEIEDVLAEVALILCSQYGEEKNSVENPKAWLYSVLNYTIIKKYKQLNRHREMNTRFYDCDKLCYNVDFDDKLISELDIEALITEIENELNDREKTLIQCVCIKKQKYREIAEEYNTTEYAVKQKFYRLNKKIKKMANKKIEKIL